MMDNAKLLSELADARYKILVSLRPLASAKSAWNITLSALARSIDDTDVRQAIDALRLEEGI